VCARWRRRAVPLSRQQLQLHSLHRLRTTRTHTSRACAPAPAGCDVVDMVSRQPRLLLLDGAELPARLDAVCGKLVQLHPSHSQHVAAGAWLLSSLPLSVLGVRVSQRLTTGRFAGLLYVSACRRRHHASTRTPQNKHKHTHTHTHTPAGLISDNPELILRMPYYLSVDVRLLDDLPIEIQNMMVLGGKGLGLLYKYWGERRSSSSSSGASQGQQQTQLEGS
jgi:hypothetical protein